MPSNYSIDLGALFCEIVATQPSDTNVDWQAIAVTGIKEDSRNIAPGDLFVARDGECFKGTDYIAKAVSNGAVAVLVNKSTQFPCAIDLHSFTVPVIALQSLCDRVGEIAARVFDNVACKLNIIGITGTNGKTSCAHYIAQALNSLKVKTFIIGTLGNGDPSALQEASRTTPDACALQQMFAEFYHAGAQTVVMEVSSHALEQGRVNGGAFKGGAFTNLSRDHLDYHGTMQAYGKAKGRLFTDYPVEHRVLNLDDAYNRQLLASLSVAQRDSTVTFSESLNEKADAGAANCSLDNGLQFCVKHGQTNVDIKSQLLGKFNLANLLLTYLVLERLGYTQRQIQSSLSLLQPVPGRMQNVVESPSQPLCIVDYAHTPDALEKALQASRVHCSGKLTLVFGCGGDRDNGKRAEMAKVAQRFADSVIVTSDNPRTEEPLQIIDMITAGFTKGAAYTVISDRKAAIVAAINCAVVGDLVLVAGKGHEDYQEIMGHKEYFLDAQVVALALTERDNQHSSAKTSGNKI
ncbi:MAG: hypothetical protein OFPI_35270 [Osedax symbiont Rs2]|nr:MAG: hypothetical protein OFPI_35270 [Osedax symbiont Rs2]